MSKRMVETFFPASADMLGTSTLGSFLHHDVFFPEAVAQACPEVTIQVFHTTTVRSPVLLLAAIWGLWIGVDGFIKLRGLFWRYAFMSFGIMNASAIFLHSLWPAVDDSIDATYPTTYPIFWVIDTYMTGFSSTCLLWAGLRHHIKARSLPYLVVSTHLIGIGCIFWFLLNPSPRLIAASHPLEAWYLATPAIAGLPVIMELFGDTIRHVLTRRRQLSAAPWSLGQLTFCLGAICGGGGIGFDRYMCYLFANSHPLVRDLMTAPALTFLGCDLCFWGIRLALIHPHDASVIGTARPSLSEAKND